MECDEKLTEEQKKLEADLITHGLDDLKNGKVIDGLAVKEKLREKYGL